MKQRSRARASSLFLLELIIAILFFSIASAVCVRVFVKAHSLSEQSQLTNWAVGECSSVAEIVCTSDTVEDAYLTIMDVYPDALNTNASDFSDEEKLELIRTGQVFYVTIGYDKDFVPCVWNKADYILDIVVQNKDGMLKGDITALPVNDEDPYFELHPEHYTGISAPVSTDETGGAE